MITTREELLMKANQMLCPPGVTEIIDLVLKERDAALAKAEAFRYVAIQNYNAPESISDSSICSLVDSEADERIRSRKGGR